MSQEEIQGIKSSLMRLLDLLDQVDDPDLADRLQRMAEKKVQEMKAAKNNQDERTQTAVDVLDNVIQEVAQGRQKLAESKLDIEKLRVKLNFIDGNLPEIPPDTNWDKALGDK